MKLSPLDVEHHEFDTGMNGYKKTQVREFLGMVADALESVLRENQQLKEEVQRRNARIEELQVSEVELKRAVISAERLGNEIKLNAQREAELIVQETEMQRERVKQDTRRMLEEAESLKGDIIRDAELRLKEASIEYARLQSENKLFREQFRGMLKAYERSLDHQPAPIKHQLPNEDVLLTSQDILD